MAREFTFKNFGKVCLNCGSTENIHLDHIIPRVKDSKGERWLDLTNLQPLCGHCNSSIKGMNDTDYRTDEEKQKAKNLKPLFESQLISKGLKTRWYTFNQKKNDIDGKQGESRKEWKAKLRQCAKLGMTHEEIVKKFNIIQGMKDYKYVNYYLNYILSEGLTDLRKRRKEKQKRKKFNKKVTERKMRAFSKLYDKRNELSKEQLIRGIEAVMTAGIDQ